MSALESPHSIQAGAEKAAFRIEAADSASAARAGELRTRRGVILTPTFMPVGTQATVKSLTPEEVAGTGAAIVLANTYHLMLRPGVNIISEAGGLHRFMHWPGTILTDSGGFQVFSLGQRRRVLEEGVLFRSHLDGSLHELTPESSIDLQLAFDSDILMPLDELVGFGADEPAQLVAMERTHRWLARGVARFKQRTDGSKEPPLLFGIAQGGFDLRRRVESAAAIAEQEVDGCAVGGLSVGEPKPVMDEMLAASISGLPRQKPRYLMGVGSPEDLWRGVAAGVDMFDCVHPTRVARRGALFTPEGRVNVKNARFQRDFGPVDPTCDCPTCRDYSAAYLNHLFRSHELLGYRLASIHNLRFIQRQMEMIRAAIIAGRFGAELSSFLSAYRVAHEPEGARPQRPWREGAAER